ncbi:MAG: ASKHA domain-containing protein [Thermodesulfobacteriota bacterium]|nr:ASKHA domain-containing protein [Thermodesulfobacteriota bacterium]
MFIEVDFQPVGRHVLVEEGATILEAAQATGVGLSAVCGGTGVCGACLVRLASDAPVSPPNSTELSKLSPDDLAAGLRLACQVQVYGSISVDVPPESLTALQRTQVEGEEQPFDLKPAVIASDLSLSPAGGTDLRADWERLGDAMAASGAPRPKRPRVRILARLSKLLREHEWRVQVGRRGGEVIRVAAPGTPLLGLAVDVGTTKVAGYLVDLISGETLAMGGLMNPQIAYGEDVMARISYSMEHEKGLAELQGCIRDALNGMARDLCADAAQRLQTGSGPAYNPNLIAEAVIVGNTAMHHLVLGLPVRQLGLAPYVAAVSSALDVKATEIGLTLAPGANVHLTANIAGFVGGDHVSMLLATRTHLKEGAVVISLDIGTNTEITLAAHGRMIACSTASGPAFEGAHIRDGMRAAEGAIERVRVMDGQIEYQVIGGEPPVGLCGSGILDAIAQLRLAGVINQRGAMDNENPLVRAGENGPEVVIAPASATRHKRDITLSRKDLSEIQLAKGAIRAGIEILLKEAGLAPDNINEFIIAGAFGSYIDVASALTISMFPQIPLERFRQVGNAAGMGARLSLLSSAERAQAEALAAGVEYLELTNCPGFQDEFIEAMSL